MESGSKKSSSFVEQTRKASRVEGEPRKKDESKLGPENDEPSSISTTANAQAEVGTETEIGSEVEIGTVTEIGNPAIDESEQEAMLDHNDPTEETSEDEDETEVDPEKVLPDFASWSEYKKEDDGFPCLIVPHDKKVVEAIDETQLDPLPQVPFVYSANHVSAIFK
jgi:hypothetical protein